MGSKPTADQQGRDIEPHAVRNLVIICTCLASSVIANTMLMLAVPFRAIELEATPALVGVILATPYFLPLFIAIPVGGLIARIGGKRIIIAGAAGMCVGPLLSLLVPNLVGLVLTQLVIGLAHMVLVLAAQSVVSGLAQGKQLERYFGWYSMCLSGGQLGGPILAGWLIDDFSLNLTFMVVSAIPLVTLGVALFLVGSARQGRPVSGSLVSLRAQLTLARTNAGVQLSLMTTVTAIFVLSVHSTFLPVYLETLAISASAIGVLLSLRALSSTAVRVVMSPVIELLGGRIKAIITAIALLGGSLLLTGLVGDNLLILGLLAVAIGLAGGISQPLSMVILSEHVIPEQRSACLALRLMSNRCAQLLGPILIGVIAERSSFAVAFAAVSAVLLVVFFTWLRRSRFW